MEALHIQPVNSLKREMKEGKIIEAISKRLSSLPNFLNLKNDLEVLTLCCNICEHLANNKNKKSNKYDKKKLVLQAFSKSYGALTKDEEKVLEKNVEYLWSNGKIVASSVLSICGAYCWDWCKRRIL